MAGDNGGAGHISLEAMRRHLDGVFIGYRPGDPTAGPPPDAMPPPAVPLPPGSRQVVDLREMSQAQLQAAADATVTRDFFAALLPEPPGVPPGRIAYVTGHEPTEEEQEEQRQQQGAAPAAAAAPGTAEQVQPGEEQIAAVVGRFLGSPEDRGARWQLPSRPWAELGMARGGPRVGALVCDLRALWRAAHSQRGGWEAVEGAGQWALVSKDLGAADAAAAAAAVRQWYQRFLLPYERSLQQQSHKRQPGSAGKKKAAAAAAADWKDSGPAAGKPAAWRRGGTC